MSTHECDVLIIGAGLAGGCLARQLRLEHPDLAISVVDRKTEFDWWVGESSVEAFDDYLTRVLKLGPYMMSRHIAKHGLRFFFDSAEKDLPMERLSEIGRSRYIGTMTAWQIDRAAFDRDLCRINQQSGVDVRLGVTVRSGGPAPAIILDGENGHVVQTTDGPIRCRYLIDAAGRSSPVAQSLGLVRNATEGSVGSYWARVENFRNIDELGTPEWRQRVSQTQRFLSTNHFMYRGYWFWHIPVSHDVLSIGVTFDRNYLDLKLKSGDELLDFVRQHRALADIVPSGARVADFKGLKHLSRCADQFFSTDRWFMTGMAGMFVDPIFSTSSSLIAANNRFIAAAMAADLSGDRATFENRVRHFNVILPTIFRTMSAGVDYNRFGSFDACACWLFQRFQTYLNTDLTNQVTDYQRVLRFIDSHAAGCSCSREHALETFRAGVSAASDRLVDEFIAFLEHRSLYEARNADHFIEGTARLSLLERAWHGNVAMDVQKQENLTSYEAQFRYYVYRMLTIEGFPWRERAFMSAFNQDFSSGQTLAAVFEALRAAAGDAETPSTSPDVIGWTPKGPITRAEEQVAPWHGVFTGPNGSNEALILPQAIGTRAVRPKDAESDTA